MFPSQVEFLRHILDECVYVEQHYKEISFNDFCRNKTYTNAVCRSLEIIGEATKNVLPEIKSKYPLVDWKRMAGIRDIIIHQYFGLDYEVIWDTIQIDIPDLKVWIEKIIVNEKESN
jgi:uncharacterized protein with HEPN domain